jgi:hypothetical protein
MKMSPSGGKELGVKVHPGSIGSAHPGSQQGPEQRIGFRSRPLQQQPILIVDPPASIQESMDRHFCFRIGAPMGTGWDVQDLMRDPDGMIIAHSGWVGEAQGAIQVQAPRYRSVRLLGL